MTFCFRFICFSSIFFSTMIVIKAQDALYGDHQHSSRKVCTYSDEPYSYFKVSKFKLSGHMNQIKVKLVKDNSALKLELTQNLFNSGYFSPCMHIQKLSFIILP